MKQYDVVIVGAGIAGGLIALELAKAGKQVLILEAGDPIPSSRQQLMENFYRASAKTPGSPYPENKYAPFPDDTDKRLQDYYVQDKNRIFFKSTYDRLGGGTTWHWLGTSLRLLPSDFEMATRYRQFTDWPIKYDELNQWYSKAEWAIGVAGNAADQSYLGIHFPKEYDYPMEQIPISLVDQFIAKKINGMRIDNIELNVTATPQGRNAPFRKNYTNGRRLCAGNTNCTPLCPIEAKYDATFTLNEALNTKNVDIWYRTVVKQVQINPDDGKVKAVEYIQYAPEVGKIAQSTVSAKIFVLAAHGIETAKILLMSKSTQYPQGVANSSGLVGKNLMDHPVLLVWGELPEPVFPFRGPLSTAGIENLRDGDFRKERAAFRIEIGNEGWNWPTGSPDTNVKNLVDKNVFGKELKEALANTLTRQMRLGFLIEQDPVESSWTAPSENPNEVDALGIPRPVIHYDFGDYTKRGFVAALKTAEMLFQQMGIATLHRNTDPKNTGYFEYDGIPFTFEGAGHVMGTYRMGEKPSNSVVNKDQRSWDHENLFLVGSGTFPTVATANPTLTLAALCLRTAEIIKQQC